MTAARTTANYPDLPATEGLGLEPLHRGFGIGNDLTVRDATFGPGGPRQTYLDVHGWEDAFVARYAADGSLLWADRLGGPWDEDNGVGVAALPGDAVVVTGDFQDKCTFGAEIDNLEPVLFSSGWNDVFLVKYSE